MGFFFYDLSVHFDYWNKFKKKNFFLKKFRIPPHMNLFARPNSYGGVHEIFFRKKIFSWFYSRYQNVPISHKKICLQIFPNTKGLATIRLQNRALSPPKSALFCSFIMDLPLVLGNFWVVIFFCLSSTFWYLDQFLKSKMMNFPCL